MAITKILMDDETTVDGTLNFGALFALREQDPQLEARYHTIYKKLSTKMATELEMAEFLYIAYVCAHLTDESRMSLQEFLTKLSDSRKALGAEMAALYGSRVPKGQPSGTPSRKPHRA